MLRLSSLSIALVVCAGTVGADTFQGWQYTAPPGYVVEEHADHVAFTKQTDTAFCSLALFEPRERVRGVAEERAFEWHNVVTHAA